MSLCRLSRLFIVMGFSVLSVTGNAEPALPGGLDEPVSSEPELPSGIGAVDWEEAWPADGDTSAGDAADDEWGDETLWGDGDQEASIEALNPITGFWEFRLGNRFSPAANQRDATLAEGRLELEKDLQWQSGSGKITADLVYDSIEH